MPDIIIKNGTIVDGTGAPAFQADLAVSGDRIEAIGDLNGAQAPKVIDASGQVVCPGIIDVHSHADMSIYREDHDDLLEPLVRQGITTFVGGNCGMGLAPIGNRHPDLIQQYLEAFTAFDFSKVVQWKSTAEFIDTLESRGVVMNCAMLCPHGLLRIDAQGFEGRPARDDEIAAMSRALEESMDQGCVGLSTGLQYFPGLKSETRELVELGRVLKKYDGVFASHIRSYSNTMPLAVDEVVEVARANDINAQISHIFFVPDFGFVAPVLRKLVIWLAALSKRWTPPIPLDIDIAKQLKKLDDLRAQGTNVLMDVMPTTTGFTHLLAFFPPWALQGSLDDVKTRLADPETRKRILHSITKGKMIWPHLEDDAWTLNLFKVMGWTCCRIMSVVSEKNKHLEGRSLVEIARERGVHPLDAACDLLLEEDCKVLVFESMAEPEDGFTERSTFAPVKHPETPITTDTILMGFGKPSYLFYATYPKFFGRYVREKKMLDMETAVRKVTGLPAKHFHLKGRGELKAGNFADILVFNPETIAPRATFTQPIAFPQGIGHVFINGAHVVEGDTMHKQERRGRVLRRA
jgi:N-acyl-D-aspartate/D-glutamate deacylase